MNSRILSIQVGMPKVMVSASLHDGEPTEWESGIFKHLVAGPVFVGATNIVGDGQSDLVHHGGTDRAVLVYSHLHYPSWEALLGHPLPPGAFGENFTVDRPTEEEVCVGDVWETDHVTLQVSQPRLPCTKLARRLNAPGLHSRVMEAMQGGWYCRVLREGLAEAGDELRLIERLHPEWTIQRAFKVYVSGKKDPDGLRELAALPQISQLWKDTIATRLGE